MTRYGRHLCLLFVLFQQHNRMNVFVCQMAVKVFKSLWSSCIGSSKNMFGMALNIERRRLAPEGCSLRGKYP